MCDSHGLILALRELILALHELILALREPPPPPPGCRPLQWGRPEGAPCSAGGGAGGGLVVVLVVFVVVGAKIREHTERLRTTTHPTHRLTITITNHHHNENMRHLCAVGTATSKMSPRNTE